MSAAHSLTRVAGHRCLRQLGVFPGVSTAAAGHQHGQQRGAGLIVRASSSSASGYAGTSAASNPPRVVVLGGGFGGLYAAVRLDQLLWPKGTKPEVVVVDQSDKFVFKPLLYEVINGTASEAEVAPSFHDLLAPYPAVRFVQAQVGAVEPAAADAAADAAGHVALADGTRLPYDFLVVALGSTPDARGVPGVTEWSVPFNSFDDAMRARGTLDLLADSGAGGKVVVVGAGYAGVELSAVVAERLRGSGSAVAVQLITPGADIMESSPSGQRESARRVLADLGVEVMTGTRVLELTGPTASASEPPPTTPTACCIRLERAAPGGTPSSSLESADLVVWTAGSSPVMRRAARSGFPFPVSDKGAILTEPTLQVHGMDRAFALGDVASAAAEQAPGSREASATLPATAQVAFQQADYVAWNIWASINKRQLLPFRYQHLGNMMALGQLNAAVALPIPLPAPLAAAASSSPLVGPLLGALGVKLGGSDPESGVTLEGPLAALVRRGAYLYRQPTNEQRMSVAASWLQRGLQAAASVVGSGGGGGRS